jgi:hypothetical protein
MVALKQRMQRPVSTPTPNKPVVRPMQRAANTAKKRMSPKHWPILITANSPATKTWALTARLTT